MIIKQLNLDHFGKFHDREIHLEKGINIVYGANESGKSTVHSFIQCMLFGTERLRGRGAGKDIYTKYQPWDGGGSYEGRMRLTCQDQNWRLMRNFHKDDSHLTVIDETGGREIPCREDDISSLIDGMTLSNYRNSISSGQLSLQPDGQFTTGMQSYMANMAMGATDNVDVGKALNYLKEERKKAASKFSHQEYEDCVKAAENLRRELEGRMALIQATYMNQSLYGIGQLHIKSPVCYTGNHTLILSANPFRHIFTFFHLDGFPLRFLCPPFCG